ncbi:hypothetical protein, conserved [Eimeria brunetti]|uniref:Uncharacterized protein n=1 Tax=Eimeria brunetti TaxID=51314 RepID=U6M2G5_9EIME|nr:hypothetical protein, conserved [Eimeria brunetti]
MKEPVLDVSHGKEGRSSSGDSQECQKDHGALPEGLKGAGAPRIWGLVREAVETNDSFQDASEEAEGDAEERNLEELRDSDERRSCEDTHGLQATRQARQDDSPCSIQRAVTSLSNSLGSVPEPVEADSSFPVESEGSRGNAEKPKCWGSRLDDCSRSSVGTHELQMTQGAPVASTPTAGESLWDSFWAVLRPPQEVREVVQDAPAGRTAGHAERPKQEVSPENEGRLSCADTHGSHTGLDASADCVHGAGRLVGTSWGPAREAVEAREGFHGVSGIGGREAEDPKRQTSRGSEVRSSCGDTYYRQATQDASPAGGRGAGASTCSFLFSSLKPAEDAKAVLTDALEQARIEDKELRRDVSRGSNGRSSCGNAQEPQANRGGSPCSVQEQGKELYGSFRSLGEAADASEDFQDASNGSGGEPEGAKREVSRGNKGCISCDDVGAGEGFEDAPDGSEGGVVKSRRQLSPGYDCRSSRGDTKGGQTSESASSPGVREAGTSLWSSFLSAINHAEGASESLQGTSEEARIEAREPKRDASRASEGESSCEDTQDPQDRQSGRPDSVQGAGKSICSCVGSVGEDANVSEGFQDASNSSEGAADELQREASRGSEVRSLCGDTEKLQESEEASPDNVEARDEWLCSSLDSVGEAADASEGFQDASNASEGEIEEPHREGSSSSESLSSCEDTQEGCTKVEAVLNAVECAQPLQAQDVPSSALSQSGTSPGNKGVSSPGESSQKQTMQQNRAEGLTGYDPAPVAPLVGGETGEVADSGRRIAACSVHRAPEQYYIGGRGSSDEISMGSSSHHKGSSCDSGYSSESESPGSSSDSSASRSSCSSYRSNESSYQQGNNSPTNISRDISIYESWRSCREFSSRAFGQGVDAERPIGEGEGQISPSSVSSVPRALAQDNTEGAEEGKASHELMKTSSHASLRCANYEEGPNPLPPQLGEEGEEAYQRPGVHAGTLVSTQTDSVLSASRCPANIASQQPQAASHWSPAFGLAAALSSLAHLVFTSREPLTSATHRKDVAPCTQQRVAAGDSLAAAAATEQRSQGEHPSPDAHSGMQVASRASQEQQATCSGQLKGGPSRADLSAFNAESGVGTQPLKSRLRDNGRGERFPETQEDGLKCYFGISGVGLTLRGRRRAGTAATEEKYRDRRAASEGAHRATRRAKDRSLSGSNSSKWIRLSKRQLALATPHVFENRIPALRHHRRCMHLPYEASRLRSNLSAGSEQVEESRTNRQPRGGSALCGAFLPIHLRGRRRSRESFVSDSSDGPIEDGTNAPGPSNTEGESSGSPTLAAEQVSLSSVRMDGLYQRPCAPQGGKTYLMHRTLPLAEYRDAHCGRRERRVARQRSASRKDSQKSQTAVFCGLHILPDDGTIPHLTTDSTGPMSVSEKAVDVQCNRRRTRWYSCGNVWGDYEDNAIHRMQGLYNVGRSGGSDSHGLHPGTSYSPQLSAPSEPALASARSVAWGGSMPLDMAETNLILESAVEVALNKHPQGRGCRISGERVRNEKLKMLLGGAGDMGPSETHILGFPASASADSLEAQPTPVGYRGTISKRLALNQPALACRMPPHIFCRNVMSASSLWTLQRRRPVVGEGERPLLSRSSSEAFRKEDTGIETPLQNEGYFTQEEAFRIASSGETPPTLPVQPAKRLSRSTHNPFLQQVLDFSLFEFGSAPASRKSCVVEPSSGAEPRSSSAVRTSQSQAKEESRKFQPSTMPKQRRPWACGEPVSVAHEESRPAIRTYIHRPGCRCPLCMPGFGATGQLGGPPVERQADTYSSLEVPTPQFQAGLPVVPSPPGGYVVSPMRILSSPLGPYPGYGPAGGNAIRVESPTRVRYGVGENISSPTSYFEQQGIKGSIPTMRPVYPVEGLHTPRVQTVSCNDLPPVQQLQVPERMSVHQTTTYPLEEKQHQEGYSHARPACVASAPPHTSPHDPMHSKNPTPAVSSRAVSYDELEKLRAQQEQQQKEAEELRRRQEELEKEQNKQREELEMERRQLKEQRERLEEQRHALEQEKQMLHAQLLDTSKSRCKGLESRSGAGNATLERLPVSNTDDTFGIPRNTTARTQHGPPIRHTTSTSNIVRSITGSVFGDQQAEARHGDTAVDADGIEEKDASNTVGGRQQNLQPATACTRFFSRTASVDTNDEKDPTLGTQDDLQTDPSMALSTALDKLSKIRMKLDTLQQQLEVQSQEVSSYYSALKAAEQVHSSLQQTAADCRVCYGRRHTQMQEVEKRLSVLTAQDLHPCSVDELEELAQELEGTQYKLTVVQAQRAGGAAEEGRKKPKQLLPYSSSCLPEPKSSFAIPEEPVARIGPDECVAVQDSALQEIKALGDDLEHIKTVHCEYKRAYKRLQGIMTQQVNSYDVDLQRLIAIEKNLEEKLRRLLFLNGDANYAELSDAQMQEYFRVVNLSIRKVYREIALRESGDRKRNEPRTSGSLNSHDCGLARNQQIHLDTCDNGPTGSRKHSGDTRAEGDQATGNSLRGHLGVTGNCSNPVHVPFVAGSSASRIATQRMLVHDSRLTPRQMSVERAVSPEAFLGQ